MNYTEHYHLPQWAEDDRILMTDFNEAMENLEAGLTEGYRPGNYPYVIGEYTGNGGTQTIELGFRPRFLHITGTISNYYSYRSTYQHEAATGGEQAADVVQFTDTGFTVLYTMGNNGQDALYPMVNQKELRYSYIAFR